MRCDTDGVQWQEMKTKQQMVVAVVVASSFLQYLHYRIVCKV
jgi:hypothetical protein